MLVWRPRNEQRNERMGLDVPTRFGTMNWLALQAFGWVAQLVEQGTENPRVRGSIPFPATRKIARLPAKRWAGFIVGIRAFIRTLRQTLRQMHD